MTTEDLKSEKKGYELQKQKIAQEIEINKINLKSLDRQIKVIDDQIASIEAVIAKNGNHSEELLTD